MNWNEIAAELNARPAVGLSIAIGLAVLLAMVAGHIGLAVLRRAARGYLLPSHWVKATKQPALWALYFIAVQAVLGGSPWKLGFLPALQHAVTLVIIAALSWLGVRLAGATSDAVIERYSSQHIVTVHARRVQTQTRLLARTVMTVVVIIGFSAALMTFPTVRQIGTSLLASAGLAGVVVGLAARPLFSNLLAGLQIALTQPIRLDDVVIVEGEWGVIEQILSTYVVVRIWDDRRIVMPLQWFLDHPFQNWTLSSANITGAIYFWVDYRMPVEPLRAEVKRLCEAAPEWDRRFQNLQVTDANERAMQLRVLVTGEDAGKNWDLRCRVREGLLAFIQREYPEFLPRVRAEVSEPEAERMQNAERNAPVLAKTAKQ